MLVEELKDVRLEQSYFVGEAYMPLSYPCPCLGAVPWMILGGTSHGIGETYIDGLELMVWRGPLLGGINYRVTILWEFRVNRHSNGRVNCSFTKLFINWMLQPCCLPTSRRWLNGEGVQDRTWRQLLVILNTHCSSLAAEIEEALGVERQPSSEQGKHRYRSPPCIVMSAAATLYSLHYCPPAIHVQVH